MTDQYKYHADVKQNNKVVVSYDSNDLPSIKGMLQSLADREPSALEAKIIDYDLDDVVFSINIAS